MARPRGFADEPRRSRHRPSCASAACALRKVALFLPARSEAASVRILAVLRWGKNWHAPSERIRTASEIAIEVDLTDEDAVPVYLKISEKVLHLRRLGMTFASIAGHLGVNLWMAKKAARWGKIHHKG